MEATKLVKKVVAPNKLSFATCITAELAQEEKNLVVSPYSIVMALKLLEEASEGKTLREIRKVIGSIKSIDIPQDFKLKISNSIWVNGKPNEDYLKTIIDKYQSECHKLTSGKLINKWVREKTNNLIDNIVPDDLDKDCASVLVNAIYFLAKWHYKFDKDKTQEDGEFSLSSGGTVQTPLMVDYDIERKYYEEDNAKFLLLPYKTDAANFAPHMIFALPEEGFSTESFWQNWEPVESAKKCSIVKISTLLIPRFKINFGQMMNDVLISMGIVSAFDMHTNDITKILANHEPLHVGFVNHKAFIKVDEEGTEAAAATGLECYDCENLSDTIKEPVYEFIADRPFCFAIIDLISSTVLFTGTIEDPTKEN